MKILLVGFNLSGAMGDGFEYFLQTLPNYDTSNNKWYAITSEKMTKNYPNIDIKRIKYNKKNILSLLVGCKEINNFLKKENFDKVVILTPNFVYNILIAKKCANKLFYFLHDPSVHEGEPFIRKNILNIQNYFLCKKSSKIIIASSNLINMIKQDKFRQKAEVIQLGLLKNLVYDDIKEADITKETDILFFGRIEKYKGLDILAKAIEILHSRGINYKCKIIGKGNMDECIPKESRYYFDIINEYVSNKKLALEIKKSKIVVLPYKVATGTQTIQIAYYYGCAVVASDTGCFVDYVIDDRTGKIFRTCNSFDLANKLQAILTDDLYVKYQPYEKAMINNMFSDNQIAEKYYRILEN